MPNSNSKSASSVAAPAQPNTLPQAVTPSPESQLLQIGLADQMMLLPVAYLVEILTVPIGQVVPVFHLPAWIPGVYNWRGDILWTVDLGHLLGLSPWYQQTEYGAKHTIVVLDRPHSKQLRSEERSPLGLIVNGVDGMVAKDLAAMSPTAPRAGAADTSDQFIQGQIPDAGQLVLDGTAILAAMP